MVSSLSGKVQKLKVKLENLVNSTAVLLLKLSFVLQDRQYGKLELFTPHNNPSAKVESSINHYGKFSLAKAYEGKNYFWGLSPKAGDTIQFTFDPPIRIGQ
jgi:hypothetical protein